MSLENAGKGNPAALCVCVGFINTTAKPGAVWTTDIATVTSQVALSFKMRSPSWLQKTACDKVRWVWLWNNCGWPVGSQWTSWTIPLLSLHFQTLLKIYKIIFIFLFNEAQNEWLRPRTQQESLQRSIQTAFSPSDFRRYLGWVAVDFLPLNCLLCRIWAWQSTKGTRADFWLSIKQMSHAYINFKCIL